MQGPRPGCPWPPGVWHFATPASPQTALSLSIPRLSNKSKCFGNVHIFPDATSLGGSFVQELFDTFCLAIPGRKDEGCATSAARTAPRLRCELPRQVKACWSRMTNFDSPVTRPNMDPLGTSLRGHEAMKTDYPTTMSSACDQSAGRALGKQLRGVSGMPRAEPRAVFVRGFLQQDYRGA